MKRIYSVLTAMLLSIVIGATAMNDVVAQPSTNLKIMIFPLECSIDVTNVGVGVYRNLTPENCMDPIEEPVAPVPIPTPDGGQEAGGSTVSQAPARLAYPSFYSSLGQIFLPTDMSERISPIAPVIANTDDTRIVKSLPNASSLTWLPYVVIAVPVLLLLLRLWQAMLALVRKR